MLSVRELRWQPLRHDAAAVTYAADYALSLSMLLAVPPDIAVDVFAPMLITI